MPTEKDYQRQAVCFALWCQYLKKPGLSILEFWSIRFRRAGKWPVQSWIPIYKNDNFKFAEYLQLPDENVTYNGLVVGSIPTLCMYLKRFPYPCCYGDMVSHFARPLSELSIVTNHMIYWIYNRWHHLLSRYNHDLLSPANLMWYPDAIYRSGEALENCWGFIDGTVRPVCRPGENQRAIYNGHKRVHSIKFQPVALPNGLVGHLARARRSTMDRKFGKLSIREN